METPKEAPLVTAAAVFGGTLSFRCMGESNEMFVVALGVMQILCTETSIVTSIVIIFSVFMDCEICFTLANVMTLPC